MAVVAMASRQHGVVIADLAARVAEVGKLELVDALELVGERALEGVASGPRVEGLEKSIRVKPGVVWPKGPVLLIDAVYKTGWSATVAAAKLREAGSGLVLPLVVHQQP